MYKIKRPGDQTPPPPLSPTTSSLAAAAAIHLNKRVHYHFNIKNRERCTHKMAEDSDGTLKAVVICEGDLHDPDFPKKFRSLLGKLKSILSE